MLLAPSPLKKAKTLIMAPPTVNADLMETLNKQIADTNTQISKLFGCESEMKSKLSDHLIALHTKRDHITALSGRPDILNYKTLSTDVLKWRDRRGMPLLVPFMLNNPVFCIHYRRWQCHRRPNVPAGMDSFYDDVCRLLERKSDAKNIEITARFAGAIPDEAREAIHAAEKVFGSEAIVLLSDTKLKINKVRLTPIDPIAAAFKFGKLFYICDFDLTPLEKAALEFPGAAASN